MTTVSQVVTALPAAPDPAVPSTFSTLAAAMVLAIKAMVTEINAWATQVNTVAGEVNTNAATATTGASTATTQAATATTQAGIATTQATAAAASATTAAGYGNALVSTSTTSLLIAVASKSFTTQTAKQYAAGQYVMAASAANVANFMHGQVTSYNSSTGALVVNVLDIGGSGTFADWNISLSAPQGTAGTAGVGVLTRVEVSGTTQTATASNDYWLENVAATAVTANTSPVDGERFGVTPANGLKTNTIDFGSANVIGPALTFTGVLTLNAGMRMTFKYSTTLTKWVVEL